MTTANIRERLHHFIDETEDKRLKAMYTLFEDQLESMEYTHEFKEELDKRYAAYKKDGKVFSREDVDKRVKKILSKAK